ncbi:uncharacterized protein LOC124201906 isoform X2 [Daphnia pulex]|uniref:uncharacterized protein LOC124201906 isoform X2 n=1 Tax=Daphnia pulex TaxID=6669 RepID=UPI001EDFFD15|nr:uncharacterized protein LOC124201906 isoform X2 [Daphnia pulex]
MGWLPIIHRTFFTRTAVLSSLLIILSLDIDANLCKKTIRVSNQLFLLPYRFRVVFLKSELDGFIKLGCSLYPVRLS